MHDNTVEKDKEPVNARGEHLRGRQLRCGKIGRRPRSARSAQRGVACPAPKFAKHVAEACCLRCKDDEVRRRCRRCTAVARHPDNATFLVHLDHDALLLDIRTPEAPGDNGNALSAHRQSRSKIPPSAPAPTTRTSPKVLGVPGKP